MSRSNGAIGAMALLWAICCSSGCASRPSLGHRHAYYTTPELVELTKPVVEQGRPRPIIDTVGWVLGIPSKILLWDRRVDNHDVSPATQEAIIEYLAMNELDTVKVRVNQYAPLEDWNRLVANKSVGWGWRYTIGTVGWLGNTIFPGRIFGGDNYNPFTNTIHLYSDVPAIALHEGGHAKDFAQRNYKGTYAFAYLLPGVPLWHEAVATRDALTYLRDHGSSEEEQEACRILYPAYSTYVGGLAADVLPWNGELILAAAVVPGHVLGRLRARAVARERGLPLAPMQSMDFTENSVSRASWEMEPMEFDEAWRSREDLDEFGTHFLLDTSTEGHRSEGNLGFDSSEFVHHE